MNLEVVLKNQYNIEKLYLFIINQISIEVKLDF